MESPSVDHRHIHHRKRVIQELNRGRELAEQLMRVALGKKKQQPFDFDDEAENLAMSISASFTEALSILNHSDSAADQTSQSWSSPDGRGRHNNKRRKTSHTRTTLTTALADDGHAWRKYGQKVILNAQYPRNYYRCTHKYDQGCQATKQVQKTSADPPMYRITYYGHHSCLNLKPQPPPHQHQPHIILDSTDSSSLILSFASNPSPNPTSTKSHSNYDDDLLLFPMAMAKQQQLQPQMRPVSAQPPPPPTPPLTSSSFEEEDHFLSSRPMTALSSVSDKAEPDVVSPGVYSCTTSTRSSHSTCTDDDDYGALDFDADMMVGGVDFGDVFLAI